MTRRCVAGFLAFLFLLGTLITRPAPPIEDFDQSFYFSIAHDLNRYGVYTNGVFGPPGGEKVPPPAGMFFMPLYPLLIWGAMQFDGRFEKAISCANNIRFDKNEHQRCPVYSLPMMLLHALMLALGALAVATAGALILKRQSAFYVTLAIATLGLYSHAGLFIYMMTESLAFCLFSLCICALVFALDRRRAKFFALTGIAAGLLVLTRPSFLALLPALVVISYVKFWFDKRKSVPLRNIAMLVFCFTLALSPWLIRNAVSVGKWGLSEEYGAGIIIERLGYNKMTLREGLLAFPACIPQIGNDFVSLVFGQDAMNRWGWSGVDTFYGSGSERRAALMGQGRLDPIVFDILASELHDHWWRHALTSVPITWCGLWVGHLWGLIFIPILMVATVIAIRRRDSLFIAYLLPALAMGLVHGALANHNVRFNIGFIGPIAVGASYLALEAWTRYRKGRFGFTRDLASPSP